MSVSLHKLIMMGFAAALPILRAILIKNKMNQINIKSSKESILIQLLSNIDKRRNYILYIASCYFNPNSARKLIKELRQRVNLSEVIIYIDRKTASVLGKDCLIKFCASFNDFEVNLYAVDTGYLFHTKAYALISYNNDDEIVSGSLVIGSANLTDSGLTAKNGNIESFLDSQDEELLQQFYLQLDELETLSIDEIDEFRDSDDFNFRYALLREGAFIHKWLDNLNQSLSVKHDLNELGRQCIDGDDIFGSIEFNVESATISKSYFNFDYNPPRLENAGHLTRNYGIETKLGYWIPQEALKSLFEKSGFEDFKRELKTQLTLGMEDIKQKINKDFEYLKNAKVIKNTDSNPAELFDNRVQVLLENDLKLKRIFSKYEIFDLPYDIQQKDEIETLFDEMLSFIESRLQKNITMWAFLDSIENVSIDNFRQSISDSLA